MAGDIERRLPMVQVKHPTLVVERHVAANLFEERQNPAHIGDVRHTHQANRLARQQ